MNKRNDPLADPTIFDGFDPQPVSLADRFLVPPMSVLDREQGYWTRRRRQWNSIGIKSEHGRGDGLTYDTGAYIGKDMHLTAGTSVFDPVICELVYRWFTAEGARVLDPFAGGSVRGVTASILGRHYTGIDLSAVQIDANRAQGHLGSEIRPQWITGDSRALDALIGDAEYDLLFTCPPYADLERYSDDPRDLSTMNYPEFTAAHRDIIKTALTHLHPNRFAVWVVSDVRDRRGIYRSLVGDTITAFLSAGAGFLNEAIIVGPRGTAPARAAQAFTTTRKLARIHQVMLIFIKGDPRAATRHLQGTP